MSKLKKKRLITQQALPMITAVDAEVATMGYDPASLSTAFEIRMFGRFRSLEQATQALAEDCVRVRSLWKVWYRKSVRNGAALYQQLLFEAQLEENN